MEAQDKIRFTKEKQSWEAINGDDEDDDDSLASLDSALASMESIGHIDQFDDAISRQIDGTMDAGLVGALGHTSDREDSSPVHLSSPQVVDALVISPTDHFGYSNQFFKEDASLYWRSMFLL
jgi:hypothetical protein